MNYFELINKCLVELGYKQVRDFDELVKTDHNKIKNILNIVNAEVCCFDNWNFLLNRKTIAFPANTSEIENTIDGRITSLSIDGKKYEYCNDFEQFLFNTHKANTYSVLNNHLLLSTFQTDKEVQIVYYSNQFAQNENGEMQSEMKFSTDKPLIPQPYAEPLLVYGTCMRMKANIEYPKFNYWYNMYKDNLATMRSKLSANANTTPTLKIER